MSWIYLIIAGLLETVWACAMKYSDGFTKLIPTLITIVAMMFSVWLLGIAMKTIPLGTAYAIWTGIGTLGAVIIGILLLHEPATFSRLFFVSLIIVGLVGLKLVSTTP